MIKLRKKFALTEKDEKLLRLLSKDRRASDTALGFMMGVSRPAAAQRRRALENAGIIKGYSVIVDWGRVVEADEIEMEFEEYGEDQSYYQET
jgi:DNA-binding Lrp family transcriptional regulator